MKRDILYVFTRLFSPEDRRLSVEVAKIVKDALKLAGICNLRTFVPYRDTDQETVVVSNKAKYIYEADVQRLVRSQALVGFLNGMSKDEGICFELGYAYAIGVPTFVGITDFFNIRIPGIQNLEIPMDPVLLSIVTKIVHLTSGSPGVDYEKQQEQHIIKCIQELVVQMVPYLQKNKEVPKVTTQRTYDYRVHLEITGGQFEWSQMVATRIKDLVGNGICVTISQRLDPRRLSRIKTTQDLFALGCEDLENVRNANVVVICADSAEMDPGSAALQGFARGLDKFVILYDSKSTLYSANGGQVMSRNLMLDQSANRIAKTINEVVETILERST